MRAQCRRNSDGDRTAALASRLAREPQIAALEAVAEWAERQGVSPESVDGMRDVIAEFAADPDALHMVFQRLFAFLVRPAANALAPCTGCNAWFIIG